MMDSNVQQGPVVKRSRCEQELLDTARVLVNVGGERCKWCGYSFALPAYHYVYSHNEGCVIGALAEAVAGYDGFGDDE